MAPIAARLSGRIGSVSSEGDGVTAASRWPIYSSMVGAVPRILVFNTFNLYTISSRLVGTLEREIGDMCFQVVKETES
jgi:hypothetical protein